MSWSQIPAWAQPLWQQWRDCYQEERLPHAILLVGSAGNGKRELVEAFVRGIQCRESTEPGLPCEQCPSCLQFTSFRAVEENAHPDIEWLRVSGYSIGIDEVREHIIARVLKKANYDRNKFLIIENAQRMTPPAMNALLKSLEEPPAMTNFFLITHQPHRLLPTIRSRCQRYVLPTPSHETSLEWLCEHSLDRGEAEQALRAADGTPVRALQMQSNGQMEFRHQFEKDLEQVLHGKKLETSFSQNWNITPSAASKSKNLTEGIFEEIPMDLRLSWIIQYGVEFIREMVKKPVSGMEMLRAMKAYRELLLVREYEAVIPAPQLNLELACLALMKIPGIRQPVNQ